MPVDLDILRSPCPLPVLRPLSLFDFVRTLRAFSADILNGVMFLSFWTSFRILAHSQSNSILAATVAALPDDLFRTIRRVACPLMASSHDQDRDLSTGRHAY
jgi:hypothetical protein